MTGMCCAVLLPFETSANREIMVSKLVCFMKSLKVAYIRSTDNIQIPSTEIDSSDPMSTNLKDSSIRQLERKHKLKSYFCYIESV